MASQPHDVLSPDAPGYRGLPFLDYAQVVRTLVPLASKIGFYDARGTALWVSDQAAEPELSRHIEALLGRDRPRRGKDRSAVYTAVEQADRIFLFNIDGGEDSPLGAVGIVCRDMANSANGSAKTAARLLAPLIDILRDAWALRADGQPRTATAPAHERKPPVVAAPAEIDSADDDRAPPLAILRRTLASLTQGLQCSFGSILASNPAFTLSHRVTLEESDLEITAATDNARARLLDAMDEEVSLRIVNDVTPGRSEFSPHKVLAVPLRGESKRPAGLIVLFRNRHIRDFSEADLDSMSEAVPGFEEKIVTALIARTATHKGLKVKSQRAATPVSVPAPAPQSAEVGRPTARVVDAPAEEHKVISMEERVRAALYEDSFDLFVQRICPLRNTARPARFEVLVRLRDGDTLYTPPSFFGAAQSSQLMARLDEWVIRSLTRTLREHAATVRLGGWEFCVNVARQSLASRGFGEFVVAEVCKSTVPASLLVFELSEDDALGHRDHVESLAARLRDIGCRIALDNCRAGLGTFGSLRDWPVTCLKIDGSVIREIVANTQARSVLRALAELASHRGIETVAECVETEETRAALCEIGVDFAQGFLLENPRPLDSLFR
jgi:EAL domain-containing protein (putative c-di-GMP-specific phosphodiesterase class I)